MPILLASTRRPLAFLVWFSHELCCFKIIFVLIYALSYDYDTVFFCICLKIWTTITFWDCWQSLLFHSRLHVWCTATKLLDYFFWLFKWFQYLSLSMIMLTWCRLLGIRWYGRPLFRFLTEGCIVVFTKRCGRLRIDAHGLLLTRPALVKLAHALLE